MAAFIQRLRRFLSGAPEAPASSSSLTQSSPDSDAARPIEIAPNDPLITYLEVLPEPVELASLTFDSPAVRQLKAAGVKIIVPMMSQGELVGAMYLGARLGEQGYTGDDLSLLNNLATQAAPVMRVAQMVEQQQSDAVERERIESELRVAQYIQKTLLPKGAPDLPGWNIQAYYKSAREVGGDLYDFLRLPDGKLGIVIGDVTDKGIPSALMMAATRSTLRAAALSGAPPGDVLALANDRLCPDMPPRMFVTCGYTVLDPVTGIATHANAGHLEPIVALDGQAMPVTARGMPLGLMSGAKYEQVEFKVEPGSVVVFYSDGLVEAHNPQRDMFGIDHLCDEVARGRGVNMIDFLLAELATFTGSHWEQEDDVTIVTLRRDDSKSPPPPLPNAAAAGEEVRVSDTWRLVSQFSVPSEIGNEMLVIAQLEKDLEGVGLSQDQMDRLKTGAAEATMNAIEHGNHARPELQAEIEAYVSADALIIRISDEGLTTDLKRPDPPDLDKKLAGQQSPRGWGLFLIENMADEVRTFSDEAHHTVELTFKLDTSNPPPSASTTSLSGDTHATSQN